MKKFLGAAVLAVALSFGALMSGTPAVAASSTAPVASGADANTNHAMTEFSSQYRRRHYRRHYRPYYAPRYYAPRYYAPRYYAPQPYYGGYGYRRAPGIYFGF